MNNDPEQWLNKSNDYSNEIYFYTDKSLRLRRYFNYGKITIVNNAIIGLNYVDSIPSAEVDFGKLPNRLWDSDKTYKTIKDFIEDSDINFFNEDTNPELFI